MADSFCGTKNNPFDNNTPKGVLSKYEYNDYNLPWIK